MHNIAQKQIFFFNYQSWIRIRIWRRTFRIRIRQKGPDPTGSGLGSTTLPRAGAETQAPAPAPALAKSFGSLQLQLPFHNNAHTPPSLGIGNKGHHDGH